MKRKILVVDDHALAREGLRAILARTPDLEVIGEAATGEDAVALSADLSPDLIERKELAGDAITAKLTRAPGNNASIGGLKVVTEEGWFAARPSGTEDIYKIYAESFRGEDHLKRLVQEAQEIVADAFRAAGMG